MTKIVSSLTAICTIIVFAANASAKPIDISGKHGPREIEATCNKAGGNYEGSLTNYSCVKECSGGVCAVNCDRKTATCTGSVPGRIVEGRPRDEAPGEMLQAPQGQ